ncbi:MAG: ABC transporter permease [Acidobacteriia bacterium]|nr:ABC transporter permease [Terriglobia bacterium]
MPFQDLIYSARTVRKSPVFAATAVLTIALGIGASTAIFSVTNAVLLRPLPYRDPGRLVFANVDLTKRNVRDFPVSNADFFDLRSATTTAFEDVAAVSTSGPTVLPREDGTPDQIRHALVTPNMLRLLGAKIAFGRDFTEADGQPQPSPATAPGSPAPDWRGSASTSC